MESFPDLLRGLLGIAVLGDGSNEATYGRD
jgi:hypothetical protein